MDKLKIKSESQLSTKNKTSNFPTLKPSIINSKPLISLSKVDLDCMISGNNDQMITKAQNKINSSLGAHKRVLSGVTKQSSQRDFSKTTRGALYHEKKFEKNSKGSFSNNIHQTSTQVQNH